MSTVETTAWRDPPTRGAARSCDEQHAVTIWVQQSLASAYGLSSAETLPAELLELLPAE